MWNPTSNPPEDDRDVKILLECDKRPGEQITGTGFYSHQSHKWIPLGNKGKCYKVVGWNELDSDTPNFSTERL